MKAGFQAALRAADTIDWANRRLAFAVRWGLLANAVLIAGNAISRKFFGVASSTMYDVQPHFFAAAVLLMAAYTFKRDEHVRIDVITGHFSKRTQVWIDLVGYLLFLLPVCALIVYYGVPFFRYSLATGESSSSAGGLIVWPAKLLVPVGFALLLLQGLSEIIKRIAFLAGRSDGSDFAKHSTTPQDEIDAIKAANQLS